MGDVVRRYDVDAIHFDDYFYPYKIAGKPFPDSVSFVQNGGEFYPDRIDDWRRDNVNQVIRQINDTIKSIKPWMPFGISPFGVWRNKDMDKSGSKTKAGQTNYDDLYADVLLWLKNDWIDYVTPQIYWHIGKKVADYRILAKWWRKNSFGKPCYIGQGAYRLDSDSKEKAWHSADQIIRQIKLNRRLKGLNGSMFFCSKNFTENRLGINEALQAEVYQSPALNLENNNYHETRLEAVKLQIKKDVLTWNAVEGAIYYVVYQSSGKSSKSDSVFCITTSLELQIPRQGKMIYYSVKSVDRGHYESVASNWMKAGK